MTDLHGLYIGPSLIACIGALGIAAYLLPITRRPYSFFSTTRLSAMASLTFYALLYVCSGLTIGFHYYSFRAVILLSVIYTIYITMLTVAACLATDNFRSIFARP